ncbi:MULTISPECIES: inner membrane-spanning protein YciB [Pseudidiomarina]|uniref:Inner membrane-spanning protein YciB n=2 Tax=Pseudidiomarina TaxID=2800384 RepID=A0A368UR40_9GAMM|nr:MULTISPECIES: inner membrane-spanning protein YciB [Pseudidiomarina]PWW11153.1 intracellular septation protein A [Pseudidiomarina maritima]RBP88547.1 intracellular septation protein [Pseudidiomarina tainanensis]RCW30500.1 intracellular septation protein [Pseudidiomarina tainanensis]
MLLVLEYLPIVIFFIAYLLGDIFLATAALMVATLLQVVIMKLLREPVTTRHWIVMWAVLLFGGVTLFLNDDWFVKIKVTVIYIAIALFLLIGTWWNKLSPLQAMLGSEIQLPHFAWIRLTYAWVVFSLSLAVINLYIIETMSLDAWVNFKVFGILGATLVFSIGSGAYMFKHHTDREKDTKEID